MKFKVGDELLSVDSKKLQRKVLEITLGHYLILRLNTGTTFRGIKQYIEKRYILNPDFVKKLKFHQEMKDNANEK